jgi:hypothetical protein
MLRARSLFASVCFLGVCLVLPLTAAASERPYAFYTVDGRALHSSGALLWLAERSAQVASASLAFRVQPVAAPEADAADGDLVWIRSQDGRYLTRWGRWAFLTRQSERALRWQVVRAAGPGVLGLAEQFALRTSDGRFELDTQRGALVLRPARQSSAPWSPWSLGCHFETGPFTRHWSNAAAFDIANGERTSEVARAVDWLRATTAQVRTPSGDLPFVVWDDPTLLPHPTVGYLITDTLWAAKALEPYDPELSDTMQSGLVSVGWYGNGLHEALFHGVTGLAHKPASDDVVHGTLLDHCAFASQPDRGRQTTHLYVPELSVDPAWTDGNSSQFVDSAVYTALNDFWHGEVELAQARLRALITDNRGSGWDTMFWDSERWVLVDQASRCDYDAMVGTCSAACSSCYVCDGELCRFYNAAYKLGLVLYAARVMGMTQERALSQALTDIEYRLWEAQLEDGGLAHIVTYTPNAALAERSGPTGEATAIAVLAHTVLGPDEH